MNQLKNETSAYLLQHADNPVAWHPWGEAALALARERDQPILLSIGYAACHWCHVMAHESFEDEETAALMNAHFINIKVDRDERPDLDKIYQTAHYLLTRRNGGWPLTLFLTPDELLPFYAGTYFPPEPRHGLPGFRDLLDGVATLYRERRDEVRRQSEALRTALAGAFRPAQPTAGLDESLLEKARDELAERYDPDHGGFGDAPKFPHPTTLEFLLQRWLRSRTDEGGPDLKALEMAAFTLKRMALGGMNDQLGGGFCRYSVDKAWMIPHFEKMLYDNAQLLPLYARGAVATGSSLFRRVATETGEWVMREMQSPEGGYFASIDADSEGEEGRFYLWTADEVAALLPEEAYLYFSHRFGFDRPANFDGRWLPHVYVEYEALERRFSRPQNEIRRIVEMARDRLLAARSARVPPQRDEKIVTAWNGLMVRGMAIAGRLLGREDFIDSAERALAYVRRALWRDGRLLAAGEKGCARLPAYLDDHAFLLDGVLELLQLRWNSGRLRFACQLADILLDHFEDRDGGGFFFTADDHERLLARPKPFADEAMPAGNAVAVRALNRLGLLLGERRYLDAAARAIEAASGPIARAPMVHSAMLTALEDRFEPPRIVVVRGEEPELSEWAAHLRASVDPRLLGFAIERGAADLPPAIALKESRDEGPVAYWCEGLQCEAPLTDIDTFSRKVNAS